MPTQPPAKAPPLRRAVYVHVSDLLSAYNIDHAKLEEELQRVKKGAAAGSSGGGVPTELDTNSNPKKLQPPRGGFNLCVYVFVNDENGIGNAPCDNMFLKNEGSLCLLPQLVCLLSHISAPLTCVYL